jgi:hypothetical protein
LIAGAAVGAAVTRHNQRKRDEQYAQDQGDYYEQVPENDTDAQVAELEKLGELKDKGILTEEEFAAKKKQILGL